MEASGRMVHEPKSVKLAAMGAISLLAIGLEFPRTSKVERSAMETVALEKAKSWPSEAL